MKILIVNYRYFVSGGPERYMFNLMELFESYGHEIIPFSVRYTKNLATPYEPYFAPSLASQNEVYFADQTWKPASFLRTLGRAFYSAEVYDSLSALIKKTQPDAAVVLHYLRKLSPSVLTALSDNKVPFVVRLSDYMMICPNAHLLRNDAVCELCVGKSILPSVKHKCVQGSLGASLVNYVATQYHYAKGYFDLVPCFVTPSKFLGAKMVEGGWDESRLVHIPTFVQLQSPASMKERKKQIAYVGRIEKSKGVHLLLDALRILKNESSKESFDALIVGNGDLQYVDEMKMFAKVHGLSNVHFLGNVNKEKVFDILKESYLSIATSIMYENTPNSILESLACGTPVIASDHGSFPEMVIPGMTGFLFEPGNSRNLARKIGDVIDQPDLCKAMSENAVEFIASNHSPKKHYELLMSLLTSQMQRMT